MKHGKLLSLSLVAALLLALLSGCGAQTVPAPETDATPSTTQSSDVPDAAETSAVRTVTDMKDRSITLDAPVQRIVALTAAECEILCALGCEEMLVGRGAYCDYPAEILDLPEVESGSGTNIEQIIALNPDIVLMNVMDQTIEQVTQLENAGIKVFVSDAASIDGTYTAIEMIGEITEKTVEAAALVDEMKSTFSELGSQVEGKTGKTVYFEVSPLEWGLWAAGAGTFMDEVAQKLGLKNIFDDVDGWGAVSEEQVLSRNPDYIVTVAMYFGEGPTPVEEILSRPGWENLTAVKNNAVLNISSNELTRPGPRLAQGAQMLFDFVYGGAN